MRGRILTLATITLILISTQGTVANPGGEGDGNRDFVWETFFPNLDRARTRALSLPGSAGGHLGIMHHLGTYCNVM